MTNFWDLPKPVREKIYRLHLRFTTPVKYDKFKELSGGTQPAADGTKVQQIMPLLLQVSYRLELEASPIFFGENSILVTGSTNWSCWLRRLWPRHAKQIRKIALEGWSPHAKQQDWKERFRLGFFASIRQLPLLESLVITVDEWKILQRLLQECDIPFGWHRSLSAGPQLYQHMMRATGMPEMLSLRNLRHVKFLLPPRSGPDALQNHETTEMGGSIPGGFLETVVRPRIMQPHRTEKLGKDREGHFRFLDLPAELRNTIYDMLLVIPGTTFPVTESQTASKSTRPRVAKSALSILCVNRQINREAYAHFYSQNDLAFATPVSLQTFLFNLGHGRLDCLRNLTFFFDQKRDYYQPPDALTPLDLIVSTLCSLRGLRKLHIILRGSSRDYISARDVRLLPGVRPQLIPGAKALFSLRNLTSFKIHSPYRAKDYHEYGLDVFGAIKKVEAAFKHFNNGLRFAQSGQLYSELYTNEDWDREVEWPAVGTQNCVCGSEQGCLCAPDSDEDE